MQSAPLYVPCPRCKGERLVWACTHSGNEFFPAVWDSFNCPLCHATGEADRVLAEEWERDHTDDE